MLVWLDGKGPSEVTNFTIDWTIRLNGDTIETSSWTIIGCDPGGPQESPVTLVIQSTPAPSYFGNITEVWLSGGTAGCTYILRNSITTLGGSTPLTEEVELPMRNR